jgi:hypothetical protein
MGETPQDTLDRLLDEATLHPAVLHVLKFFRYGHLPAIYQVTSKRFCELAVVIACAAKTPEATVALRKLLEAKDAAVRDSL